MAPRAAPHAAAALLPAAAVLAVHALSTFSAHALSVSAHLHADHTHGRGGHTSSPQHARFHEYGPSGVPGRRPTAAEARLAALLLLARGLAGMWWTTHKSAKGKGKRLSSGLDVGAGNTAIGVLQIAAYAVAARAGPVRSAALLLLAPLTTPKPLSLVLVAVLCGLQMWSGDGIGGIAMGVLVATTAALAVRRRQDVEPFGAVAAVLGALGLCVTRVPLTVVPLAVIAAILAPSLPFSAPAPGLTLVAVAVFKTFALPPSPPMLDLILLVPALALAWRHTPNPAAFTFPSSAPPVTTAQHAWYSPYILVPAEWRPHLATILRTPTSRKIFGFLCLNLAYMGVQMAYGVITNSLGLISDAIHMLFDCLGLAVGLWASVAATWKPDGQYTFGYARVETLSGFANGCFLILISIFIIVEGIQRIMNPPEMETRQLLLVSSIGLAINLFGMWATGGHHHHGHGHSHGHGHGHSHGHDHGHDHGHNHSHDHDHSGSALGIVHDKKSDDSSHNHSHDHSHSHDHAHEHKNGHDHAHGEKCDGHDHGHDHSHGHSHNGHDHGHSHLHSHSHDHGHSHDQGHDHGHGHGHSHNMQGVFLHVMADTLGSVGVIVSTMLIRATGWTGWDPLASLFIAALILASVLPLVTDAARVLALDAKDIESDVRAALARLKSIEGVASYSAARFWPKGEGLVVGSIHVQTEAATIVHGGQANGGHVHRSVDTARLVARVEQTLKSGIPGLTEIVVQLESGEFCSCMTSSGLGLLN